MNRKRTSQTAGRRRQSGTTSTRGSQLRGGRRGGREVVRGSGVYPISGPLPRGNPPIRAEAEWGHTARRSAGSAAGRGRGTPTRQRQTAGQRSRNEREIPRNQWVKFFDAFSKDHDGWLMEVVVARRGSRSRVEARRLPLQGITVDLKPGDKGTTSIILGLQPNVHLTHTVPRTKRVLLKEKQQELEITSANGEKTLAHFQSP